MPSWALVATVKAPEDKVLAFVAHHLGLGAQRIFLYFDDPEDPAHAAVAGLPRVTATRCTPAYWAQRNGRHDRHQNRQARNARDAYQRAGTDWLGHLDVDEFLHARRPVADVLADLPGTDQVLRLEPFEAMHDPALPDDIFTARAFRGSLKGVPDALRHRVLGRHAGVIPDGLLSHAVGKVFFRTGIPGLSPRLHGVMLQGTRLPAAAWRDDLQLLHFHAQDPAAWRAALPFRLTRGAYMYRPALQEFLSRADADAIDAFYRQTQTLPEGCTSDLLTLGRVILTDLALRPKVRALRETI
jgi:hypothetical protein